MPDDTRTSTRAAILQALQAKPGPLLQDLLAQVAGELPTVPGGHLSPFDKVCLAWDAIAVGGLAYVNSAGRVWLVPGGSVDMDRRKEELTG